MKQDPKHHASGVMISGSGFWSPHGASGASFTRTTCCKHEPKPDCSAEAFAQLDSLIKGVQGLQLVLVQEGLVRILTLRYHARQAK